MEEGHYSVWTDLWESKKPLLSFWMDTASSPLHPEHVFCALVEHPEIQGKPPQFPISPRTQTSRGRVGRDTGNGPRPNSKSSDPQSQRSTVSDPTISECS